MTAALIVAAVLAAVGVVAGEMSDRTVARRKADAARSLAAGGTGTDSEAAMVKRNPGESDAEFLARFGKDGVLRGRGAITVMMTMTKMLEGPVDQHLATVGVSRTAPPRRTVIGRSVNSCSSRRRRPTNHRGC